MPAHAATHRGVLVLQVETTLAHDACGLRPRPAQQPKVFSPLYVMYKKPSSSLWSSYTSDMRAAAYS